MTHILIPRSDNTSAKTIEASDWEKYFKDVLQDYVITGFTVTDTAGCSRDVDVSSGALRLKGLYLSNSVCETSAFTFGTDDTHYLYATICRDPTCEPEAWSFTSNTCGLTPTDSIYLATVVTAAGEVCSIDQTCMNWDTPGSYLFGSGLCGDVTINCNTTLTTVNFYDNLTINAAVTTNFQPGLLYVKRTLTINCGGSLEVNGDGAAGGAGGSSGGGAGAPSNGPGTGATPGGAGSPAPAGGAAGNAGTAGSGGGGAGGAGAAGGSGSSNNGSNGGSSPGASGGPGGTGGPFTGTAAGGAGGAAGCLDTMYNHVITFIGASPKANAWGGGGGGAGAGKGGGGGGAGGRNGGSPNAVAATGGAGGVGGTSTGGAGGKGGGTLVVIAKNVIINSGGVLSADGADGGVPSLGGGGGGASGSSPPMNNSAPGGPGGTAGGSTGGGGGGGGGIIMMVFSSIVNNGTYSAAGGAGGAGNNGGGPSSNPGSAGSTGAIIEHRV